MRLRLWALLGILTGQSLFMAALAKDKNTCYWLNAFAYQAFVRCLLFDAKATTSATNKRA